MNFSAGPPKATSFAASGLPDRAFLLALERALDGGVATIDREGRQTYVNAMFCRMVGWTEAELLGAAAPFVYWPPEERESIRAAFEQTIRGEIPTEGFELKFQRRGGERFDVRLTVAPIAGDDGQPAGWLASICDTSEKKKFERRRAVEHEAVRILTSAKSLSEAAPEVIQAICVNLGWDMGALWRVDRDSTLKPLTEQWLKPPASGRRMTAIGSLARGSGLPGSVWETGEPLWISGFDGNRDFLRADAARSEGFRSALLFPIPTASGIAGVMEFFGREERAADDDLVITVATLGRQIGQFIEREEAEAALRRGEARYRAIVETANEGVWLIDAEGRTLYANRQLANMLGVSGDELFRCAVPDFCYSEDVSLLRDHLGANLAGESEQFEFRFRRSDGAELVVLACTSPMRNEQGRVVGALGMYSDITERRKADEATYRMAAIVDSSDDAIVGKRLDGTIQSWNVAAERLYGYSAAEAIGRSMTMLLPPDRPDEEKQILERLSRGERVEHFETVRLRKDGREIQVSTTISPIRDRSGRFIGASSVTRDITDRKRFEEQLRDTQKLESLGVLAGGVAHDFNNLLVGIMGNASLALDSVPGNNPARANIDSVLLASERAANLTRQLLAYSGKGRFVVQSIDLSEAIREIVALIQTSISKNVRVRFDLDDALPRIEADVAQMQQLIMNLVINAAEATGEGPGTVVVRTRPNSGTHESGPGTYVCLEVQDSGCGMDAATRERIFDPFFTTKFTGRGLGLAAVLGIVRGHKGTIRVETAPGEGSRFTVLLPAATAGACRADETTTSGDYRGQGTILIVDDEEIVRGTAKATLERYGYRVLAASDGHEALECVKNAPEIDLVLLDLTMPSMSGEQALREMRRIRPHLRVILSSGYNEVEAIRRFQGQGLSGFLQKPYTAERLAEKVKTVAA
jgi:two-component system, cell cycle sensor histidine kinase and response regulator CckA